MPLQNRMSAAWWIGYVYISAFTWRRPRGPDLLLHRRVAIELGGGHQRHERQQQLVQLGDMAVAEEERAPVLWVEPRGQVVEDRLVYVGADGVGGVAVGEHLVVGDDDERGRAQVLDAHAVGHGAEQVADVQGAGGPLAGEDAILRGIARQVLPDGLAAPAPTP